MTIQSSRRNINVINSTVKTSIGIKISTQTFYLSSNFTYAIIFGSLEESFAKVQEMAAQTAQATQEQSTVSGEINENLSSMQTQTDEVQAVSDLVQSQSKQISDLFEELDRQVGSFKV